MTEQQQSQTCDSAGSEIGIRCNGGNSRNSWPDHGNAGIATIKETLHMQLKELSKDEMYGY